MSYEYNKLQHIQQEMMNSTYHIQSPESTVQILTDVSYAHLGKKNNRMLGYVSKMLIR